MEIDRVGQLRSRTMKRSTKLTIQNPPRNCWRIMVWLSLKSTKAEMVLQSTTFPNHFNPKRCLSFWQSLFGNWKSANRNFREFLHKSDYWEQQRETSRPKTRTPMCERKRKYLRHQRKFNCASEGTDALCSQIWDPNIQRRGSEILVLHISGEKEKFSNVCETCNLVNRTRAYFRGL